MVARLQQMGAIAGACRRTERSDADVATKRKGRAPSGDGIGGSNVGVATGLIALLSCGATLRRWFMVDSI